MPNVIEIWSVVLKVCVQTDICIFCEQGKVLSWVGLFFVLCIYLLLNNAVSC
jgi:hypothetical protein